MVIYMFYNYKIKNDILYLYVDDRCEIGSLFNSDKNRSITSKVKKYIKDHKIEFNGFKVILLLSGLMLGTVYLNKNPMVNNYDVYKDNKYVYNIVDKTVPDISVEEKIDDLLKDAAEIKEDAEVTKTVQNNNSIKKQESKETSNNTKDDTANSSITNNNNFSTGKVITLNRTRGDVVQINLEEYLIGVVAAEMPASFNLEALKSQAIVARTYTLKLLESGRIITDDVSTQVYKDNAELKNMWGNSYNTYYNRIKNAVSSTSGLCITYNGSLIDAVYHSTSNGYTEDSVKVWGNDIPYLKTVTSPWDTSASSYLRENTISYDKIRTVLGINFDSSSIIEIISKDESGRISKIKFDDKELTGVEVRNLLGLRSADFDFTMTDVGVLFTTRGYGHGVGMSQYGANGMANSGYSYDKIIKYYYSGVNIVKRY